MRFDTESISTRPRPIWRQSRSSWSRIILANGRLRGPWRRPRRRYDVCLIDCPPSLGLLTVNALTAADQVLVPLQCEFLALEGLGQLLATIDLIKRGLNPDLTVLGVLMTMYDARTRLSAHVVEEVRRHMPNDLLSTIVPRAIRLAEAPSYGQVISEYDPESRGAIAYEHLADELLARMGWPERRPESDTDPAGDGFVAAFDPGDGLHDGHGFGAH